MENRGKKTEITSLDLKFLVPELRAALLDGRFRKIYQYGTKSKHFLFAIHTPEKGNFLLYTDRDKVFLTERKKEVPQAPPSFCMFLRKHLMNARIRDIRQHGFDRILEIVTDNNRLIFEFFHPGNVILCDSMGNIIMPLEIQRWKDRVIKPKVPYKYPPAMIDPFELDFSVLQRSLLRTEKTLGVFVATSLGFGSIYGTDIIARAGLDPKKPAKEMSLEEISKLHNTIMVLGRMKPRPCICEGTVAPFLLKNCKNPRFKETFSQALDEYFSALAEEVEKKEEIGIKEAEQVRIERIEKQQEISREKWLRIEKESKKAGDLIYANYSLVKGALEGLKKARDMGLSWEEIKTRIKEEGTPEAETIKEIREKDAVIVMDLGGKEIEIDIRQTVEENAARYYEDAKWARKKLEGLIKAKKELAEIGKKPEIPKEVKPEKPKRARWYEKYKWFISSEGFLVVAGRNAEQNDTLLAKHAYSDDWVFHADIPGAGFVVIQGSGKDVPEQTKREAAEFAAANSKAWSRGLGTVDVYSAPRSRISKPGGMPKGSWVYSGEREWYRKTEVKLSIGVKVNEIAKVVYGPVMAVRKNSDYFVTVVPGGKSSGELAREIKNKILVKAAPEHKPLIEGISLEEFERAIPSGTGDIVEFG